jgi:hypothetical protein
MGRRAARVACRGRRARALAIALALVLPALRLVPFVAGRWLTPPGRVFLGLGYIPKDFACYAAFMVQAQREGTWILRNDYTLEHQDPRYLLLFQSAVGHLAAWTGADVIVVWPILQWVLAVALLLSIWRLLATWFETPGQRLLALALVGWSGGLEWLAMLAARWLPKPAADAVVLHTWPLIGWNTFEALFNPQQVAALLGVVVLLGILLWAARSRRIAPGLAAFVLVPLTYAIHGYTALGAGVVLAGTFVLLAIDWLRGHRERTRELLLVGLAGAACIVPLALNRWQKQDPVFHATAGLALGWSQVYAVWWWPITYGPLLLLAGLGLARIRHRSDAREFRWLLLLGWLLATSIASQLPAFSAYKLQYLVHLPLCIAAAHGVLAARDRGWLRGASVAALAISLGLTNVWVMQEAIQETTSPHYSLPRDQLRALRELRDLERGPVFASPVTGLYVPWLAEKPVYVGQWFLTPSREARWEFTKRFFAPDTSTAWRRSFLRRLGFRYLYYGPAERRLGPLDPALPLDPVIEVGNVRVYRVEPSADAP